jgi:hypothetical protein
MMGIMAPTESRPNGRFHPQNVINFVASMSAMIGQPQGRKKVFMLNGTRKRMKLLRRSASRASRIGEIKQRAVKLIRVSASSGEANVAS